ESFRIKHFGATMKGVGSPLEADKNRADLLLICERGRNGTGSVLHSLGAATKSGFDGMTVIWFRLEGRFVRNPVILLISRRESGEGRGETRRIEGRGQRSEQRQRAIQ